MKVRLVIACTRYSMAREARELEIPDGMSHYDIDCFVSDELEQMRNEFADSWWEEIIGG